MRAVSMASAEPYDKVVENRTTFRNRNAAFRAKRISRGTMESLSLKLVKFLYFKLVVLARRQPCFVLRI